MKISSFLAASTLAWFATATTASAAAIVYNRTAVVGAATAQISITTDGTLGTLAQQGASVHNVPAITDWTVSLTTPRGSVSYGKNLQATQGYPGFGIMYLLGQTGDPARRVLTASADELTFNPGFPAGQTQGLWLQVPDPFTYYDQFSYWVQRTTGSSQWVEFVGFKDEFGIYRSYVANLPGPAVFEATGGNAAVPEPATWAMMIIGFGAVGGAMRRRKANTALA